MFRARRQVTAHIFDELHYN